VRLRSAGELHIQNGISRARSEHGRVLRAACDGIGEPIESGFTAGGTPDEARFVGVRFRRLIFVFAADSFAINITLR
jgi:hypothetical protein